MSVAPLTAKELGCFVAIAHKHLKAGSIDDLCLLASFASQGNAGAYSAQYGDPMETEDPADIHAAALDYLADRRDMVADHFGPLAYNMVANDGRCYLAPGVEVQEAKHLAAIRALSELERSAHAWQDAEHRKMTRAEENAEAFNEIGQLPVLTRAEIESKMKAAGADRVIVATFGVNESDMMSDYHGGRTARSVVIGFGKGKRENFRQLRTAAGKFPPTAHMGPGKDVYKPRVVFTNDVTNNGNAYWKGSYSHWHRELEQEAVFETEADALAFIAKQGTPHEIGFNGVIGTFAWEIIHTSYEHRECYSMGGGNYLGSSRYGGWKIKSRFYADRCEFFNQ